MIKPLNRAGQGTQDTSRPMEVDAVTNKGKGWKGEKGGKGKKGGKRKRRLVKLLELVECLVKGRQER